MSHGSSSLISWQVEATLTQPHRALLTPRERHTARPPREDLGSLTSLSACGYALLRNEEGCSRGQCSTHGPPRRLRPRATRRAMYRSTFLASARLRALRAAPPCWTRAFRARSRARWPIAAELRLRPSLSCGESHHPRLRMPGAPNETATKLVPARYSRTPLQVADRPEKYVDQVEAQAGAGRVVVARSRGG